jgi:hypothetical protein
MKTTSTILTSLSLCLAASYPACAAAAPTSTVYNSGILVLAFVGFCALVVVVQLIPAVMTLWGMLMGALTSKKYQDARETARR